MENSVVSLNREETENEKLEDHCTFIKLLLIVIDLCKHVLIISVTGFLLYYSTGNSSVTNLHITLCTVGYVLLMSESICVLDRGNIWSASFSRRANSHIHWVLQVVGMICTMVGVVVLSVQRTTHFRSIHAITGLTSLVIMCVLILFGTPVLYAARLRKLVRPVVMKFSHNFLGISCFVIGMVSQCYGYKKKWLKRATDSLNNIETICIVATALITLLSLLGAFRSLYHQTTRLFR